MFNFIKRVFSQPTEEPAPSSHPVTPKPHAAPPATVPATASAPAPTAPPPMAEHSGEVIQVPIIDIAAKLPAALAPAPSAPLTGYFPLPVQTALAQLPSGAVRIRFAQLREAAPRGTFSDDPSLDETLVELPLPKILAAINPSLLVRRPGQKQIEVPPEITGVFAGKEKAGAYGAVRLAAPVAASAPAPIPAKPPISAPPTIPAPAPVAPSIPVAPKPAPVQPKPLSSFSAPPAAPKPPGSTPMPFVSQKPAAPPSPPIPVPQALPGAAVTVRLTALSESWPEAVRQEIAESKLTEASVAIPMDRLDSAMKTGRIAFPWGELMQWLDVPSASIATSQRQTILELPLKVIAPLFMAQRKAPVEQKKIVVGENIPNLFEGLGKPSAPAAPAPAPVPAPVVAAPTIPAPAAPAPVPAADTLGSLLGQPAKTEWSPQEITQKINALPGVAASLIAMSDGLLVAGQLPPPMKSDTLAAFLPQMFGRMNHYAGEIQLSSLSALTLTGGQTPCAVFKAGALYLAVLGKAGQPLPEALLQKVAGEMAERSQ